MATAQPAGGQGAVAYETLVRVVTYALEDIPTLNNKWFVHDNKEHEHDIERNGETFKFMKKHYTKYDPKTIGFDLEVPDADGVVQTHTLWVKNPQTDTSINRRATIGALKLLISVPNKKNAQVEATQYAHCESRYTRRCILALGLTGLARRV